jgi:hypothetical protein
LEDRLRYFALSSEEASALRETLIDAGWFLIGGPEPDDRESLRMYAPGILAHEPTWAEITETRASAWQWPILPHGVMVEIPCG